MNKEEAARWMEGEFKIHGFLYQDHAADYLAKLDDPGLVFYDKGANLCIDRVVLKAFQALLPDAVYERSGKFWRERLDSDQPGRQQ